MRAWLYLLAAAVAGAIITTPGLLVLLLAGVPLPPWMTQPATSLPGIDPSGWISGVPGAPPIQLPAGFPPLPAAGRLPALPPLPGDLPTLPLPFPALR